MKTTPDRDLLVLFKNKFMTQWALEQEVECLNRIVRQTEQPSEFCKAHELVRRNRITERPDKILSALRHVQLRPFWFFISKN
jgi:hypothetical protein